MLNDYKKKVMFSPHSLAFSFIKPWNHCHCYLILKTMSEVDSCKFTNHLWLFFFCELSIFLFIYFLLIILYCTLRKLHICGPNSEGILILCSFDFDHGNIFCVDVFILRKILKYFTMLQAPHAILGKAFPNSWLFLKNQLLIIFLLVLLRFIIFWWFLIHKILICLRFILVQCLRKGLRCIFLLDG